MKRAAILIAGGVLLLGTGAVLVGASRGSGQSVAAASAGEAAGGGSGWSFPLPAVRGSGYSSLSGVRPGGAWPALPRTLKGPVQPLFYRHDIHAGQYRMPCLYCHNNAANSWTVNIPTESTCMGCHLVTSAPDSAGNPNPEIQKLRDFYSRGENIPWVRINKISEHAHFPHMRHVNAGLQCQTCHGNIQQMPRVFKANDVNRMGWCTDCHMRRGITRDCTGCHF
jgi:hypothetical protein